jgi:hypothetical protein
MALSLQLGYPDVPKSVTNKNVAISDTLDVSYPMPFLTFIKIINVSFEPDSLQDYYNFYLKEWNNLNSESAQTEYDIITEQYREFLKELSINYTTLEEKHFLSKIDFNDPYDLDVVMGFYGRKLKELSIFYNSKRNDVKFNVVRNKLIGTPLGAEKTTTELVLSYLRSVDDSKMLFDYNQITKDLEVEIDELFDTYPSYLNQYPSPRIYDNKDLDYGYNIFLVPDSITKATLLSGFSQELQQIKEFDDLLNNKRKLTEKYISTDFYYLSTGSNVTDFLSGKLFSADNSILNFKNREYPTTASTEQLEYLKDERSVGFFKPHKQSIILIDGDNYSYSINFDNLSPNSLYFFADPAILGKNGDTLTFVVDDSRLKRNYSSGIISTQPYSTPSDLKSYGYISKIEPYDYKYLDSIFDEGFISNISRDVYGNLFGIFNNDHRFRRGIESSNVITESQIYSVVINGHMFFDTTFWEGYNFNYFIDDDTSDTDIKYFETLRTGLSTTTAAYNDSDIDVTLFFGYFNQPYNLSIPTESNLITQYEILDGAFITNTDLTPYSDTISSDLSAFDRAFTINVSSFDSNGEITIPLTDEFGNVVLDEFGNEIYAVTDILQSFYYDTLVDGGIYSYTPPQRALYDALFPPISANLTQTITTSSLYNIDGGDMGGYFPPLEYNIPVYDYIDIVYSPTEYSTSTFPIIDDYGLNGKLMVRNTSNRSVNSILNSLTYINSQYPVSILNELDNNVVDINIINDILFIETPSYLTTTKLVYVNGNFVDPKKIAYYIEHNINKFNTLSNRFKIGTDVYYYTLSSYSEVGNNLLICPQIFKFDTINFKSIKLFPKSINDVMENSTFFTISGGDVKYVSTTSPRLTYSSRNNIFNASFLLKDQNDMFALHELDFTVDDIINFKTHITKIPNIDRFSNIFYNLSTVTIFLSSTNVNISNETLII